MNNFLENIGSRLRSIIGCLLLVVVLASCMDDDNDNITQPIPVAYVSLYHTSPNAPELDVVVDNNRINSQPFGYTDYTNYLNFRTGDRNFRFNSFNASSALVDTTFNFIDGNFYSLFVINDLSKIEAIVVADSSEAPATGKAKVRFIHLSPDAPAVNIGLDDESATPLFDSKNFKQVTDFVELDAKRYSFNLTNAGTQQELLSAEDIQLREGRFYTIIIRGFVNPPAGNNNVLSVQVVNN